MQQDSLDAGLEKESSTADWYGHAPEIMIQSNYLRSIKLLPRLLHHPPGAIGIGKRHPLYWKERLRLIFLQNIELQQEAAESLKVIAASYLVVKEGRGPSSL